MPNKKTTEHFILEAKEIHGKDKYDYSLVNYVNSKIKVKIICNEHGEFEQIPNSHLLGFGCTKCSGNYQYTTKEWIIKAKKIHGDIYDYSKVKYINANKKVNIICKIHGEFEQTPKSHLNGGGCSKCSRCYQYTTDEWIIKAKEVHGDKYDYSKVKYKKSDEKINIICKIHGEFEQIPSSHLRTNGCSKCTSKYQYTTNEWINIAKNIHKDKYDYSKVNYKNSKIYIIIICKVHGEFKQMPYEHLQSNGCPRCGIIDRGINLRKTNEEFIEQAKYVHKDKYDYSKVEYIGNKNKIMIICKIHGEFEQIPYHHLRGCGCPKCNNCPSCELFRTNGKLCEYCKPQKDNKLYQKTKEMDVVKFLREKLPDNDFIHNRSVGTECTGGHFFPDVRFDCLWFQLIVEIDEHKHRGAGYQCDEKRMYDITAKLGQPCIFIRYNPDSKDSNKDTLLEKVQYYLDLQDIYEDDEELDDNVYENLEIDNHLGFKTEYLFY